MTDSTAQANGFDSGVRVAPEVGREAMVVAAGIWARATSRRDQLPRVPATEEKLPGIVEALSRAGAQLIVARNARGKPVGSAVLEPRMVVTEVLYLAVDPSAWSQGAAHHLLRFIAQQAQESRVSLELWVIADNERAIGTYERAGWTMTDHVKVRNASGRLERLYTLSA